jgi:hypothetical protein
MIIALWIVNIVLALLFLAAGGMKALAPTPRLRERGMTWTDDFSTRAVTLIGIAEVIGAVGLIVPLATGILPLLTPIAAVCLAVLMGGAIGVHARRKENPAPSVVLLVLSIVSAVLGFLVVL